MESILTKAVKKAKAYGLPMIVYENKEINYLDYCSLDVFDSEHYSAVYVVLSNGTFEKIGTANIYHG